MVQSRPLWLRYAVAVVSIASAISLVVIVSEPAIVGWMLLAVVVTTWFGGTRPGLVATALSVLAILYFLPPAASLSIDVLHLPRLGNFLVLSLFTIWIIRSERRASDRLRRREAQTRLAIDTMPVMAWTLTPGGRLEFLNRRWLEYSGMSADEAVERANETVHPDDLQRVQARWGAMMASGEPYEDEMRLRRADGEYRWFLVRTVPFRGPNGRIVRWYGTSTDIEDRKRAEADRRRAEQALRESAERLQRLSHRLLEVQEQERRHLARELHDEFGQLLASINLRLHAAQNMDPDVARLNLVECIALVQRASEQARSLVLELRPTILETAGLDGTLRWLAGKHQQQADVQTEVVGRLSDVAPNVAIACFRVVQEALTNVLRHAQASRVWIELRQDERALEVVVRDNGAGFDVARTVGEAPGRGHVGLLGMRERVQILGGELEIGSASGSGTRIRVSFPAAVAQPALPVG